MYRMQVGTYKGAYIPMFCDGSVLFIALHKHTIILISKRPKMLRLLPPLPYFVRSPPPLPHPLAFRSYSTNLYNSISTHAVMLIPERCRVLISLLSLEST